MKKLNFARKQSSGFLALLLEYCVFLLSPEDSSDLPDTIRRQQTSRFDSRIHGAVKIFFWTGIAMSFWIGLSYFFRTLR